MTTLYKCDKCGKQFEGDNAQQECAQHEEMHFNPAMAYQVDSPADQSFQMLVHSVAYDEKHDVPVSFIAYLVSEYYDYNDCTWKNDLTERRYRLADK